MMGRGKGAKVASDLQRFARGPSKETPVTNAQSFLRRSSAALGDGFSGFSLAGLSFRVRSDAFEGFSFSVARGPFVSVCSEFAFSEPAAFGNEGADSVAGETVAGVGAG